MNSLIRNVSDVLTIYGVRHSLLQNEIILRDSLNSNVLCKIVINTQFDIKVINNQIHLINFKTNL